MAHYLFIPLKNITNLNLHFMKKLFLSLIAIAMFAFAGYAQITGSAHDFQGLAWNDDGVVSASEQICKACHTPHNAYATSPLWNHSSTVAAFTPYTNSTMNAVVGQPDAESKMCLSCHDGTVALDAFQGNSVSPATMIAGAALVGTVLTNDHPVSFTYNTALATADGGLYDPSTQNSGLGGTIDADMLFSAKMQCSSCHDVHNSYNLAKLLVKDNAGSALCLTCHNK